MLLAQSALPPEAIQHPVLKTGVVGTPRDDATALELISWAYQRYGAGLALSSSFGADSAVMIHLATRVAPEIPVVMVDTGYLFPETYRFAEELTQRLGINLVVATPKMSAARQEALYGQLWEEGDEGVSKYLELNKVEPMKRTLSELGVTAWMAGVRASQTEHRRGLPKVGIVDGRVKIHPILDWSSEEIERYLNAHDLPRHPLYHEGYKSIGDVHSTLPVVDGQDERAGRLLGAKKECGLHLSAEENTSLTASSL
jgi:phosphoadenosine phosphosulfate reductase